ncbi:membrane protein [Lysinibacillus sp. BF-4]|uniref:TIGR03826 family flagellar region protein n=1 Tax=Lysinibacillus sp. BF-4 TaxID=1473546 RepID=UPI0004FFCB95|nr:TIGR03826 family flagellar region protein [Lysinibacillus sp. BF-4]KFL43953.1 membrane protein [Lysinibacillus sp. BF-4]
MAEVRSCPKCDAFFNYTGMRDVCAKCAQAEEDLYQVVYRFLRKRENRAATVERIVEVTGVEEATLYNWVRRGRLHTAMFPNLGYPCDQCGRLTSEGKICARCREELKQDLRTFDAAKQFREDVANRDKGTYHAGKH